jgi:hypothetical protein
VTVPVAAVGETVAESVTLAPSTGVDVDADKVVVVAVVDAFQKFPQPAMSGTMASIAVMKPVPALRVLRFIRSPYV